MASFDQGRIRSVFVKIFGSAITADDDILTYLVSSVTDLVSHDREQLEETVGPFLESYNLVEASQVQSKLDELCTALNAMEGAAGRKRDMNDELELLEKPTSIQSLSEGLLNDADRAQIDKMWGFEKVRATRNDQFESAGTISKRAERKAEREQKKWLDELDAQFDGEGDDKEEEGDQISRMMLPEYGNNNERDIHVHNFQIWFGGHHILDGADLKLVYGRRYGLVGRNGVGKTTLLKNIANFEIPGFPRHHRVLHVKQEVKSSALSVLEVVLQADIERTKLLRDEIAVGAERDALPEGEIEQFEALTKRLEEIHARMDIIGVHTAQSRAASILAGLQFSPEMQAQSTDSLSGGWRMRVALAGALFIEPDLLMLDEPTNHLDLEAVLWLQEYLKSYKHTVFLVSHDREFVNEVCSDIIHFFDKKLHYYRGNFVTFERAREELKKNQQRMFEANMMKREHMQDFIDKFRYNAKRAALVQSRIKAIEKMEVVEEVKEEDTFTFSFPDPGTVGPPVIQVEGITFGYNPAKPLFTNVHFNIDLNSRIGILGPNGAGKSTLLLTIQKKLNPSTGVVHINPGLRIATFTQHHGDSFNLRHSPLQNLMTSFPLATEADLRSHLGRFQICGDDALKPMKFISGGQKSRVAFALLTYTRPHLIIMDEPTNHLDMDAIEALIGACKAFTGGVVVVSHDQHFLTSICQELWVVGGGKVTKFDDGIETYKRQVLSKLARLAAARHTA